MLRAHFLEINQKSDALKNVWELVLKTEETVVLTAIVILLGPVKVVKTPRTIKV
jgi:hypothetical protein